MSIEEVSATDAAALVEGGAWLLDVRNDDEWAAGRAPTATYITLSEVATRCREVPTDRAVIVVCRAGARSLKAAQILAEADITAMNLIGGMHAWEAQGLPVVTEHGTPGAVI